MLEKKEKLLGKKAAAEVEKAKQFTQSKNRNCEAPICSLFRFYEFRIWKEFLKSILQIVDISLFGIWGDFINFLIMHDRLFGIQIFLYMSPILFPWFAIFGMDM